MDRREQERQWYLNQASSFILEATVASDKDSPTILVYRRKRWNLTMRAIGALLRSLNVHSDEVDSILETIRQASAGSGWTIE